MFARFFCESFGCLRGSQGDCTSYILMTVKVDCSIKEASGTFSTINGRRKCELYVYELLFRQRKTVVLLALRGVRISFLV